MLDVVGPQHPLSSSEPRSERRPRPAIFKQRAPKRRRVQTVPVGPRVVQLDWRLPARLRRPVREEMRRQRLRKKENEAIVRFERRPITTTLPSGHPGHKVSRSEPVERLGAEQHTGDIYRDSQPAMQIAAPPYMGSATRSALFRNMPPRRKTAASQSAGKNTAGHSQPAKGRQVPVAAIPDKQLKKQRLEAKRKQSHQRVRKNENVQEMVLAIDDQGLQSSVIQEPRRRFALPLHFSIFPLQWGGKKQENLPVEKQHVTLDSAVDTREANNSKKKIYIRPLT